MNYPKITIVTPSFNQGHFLEETIRSVLDQNYPNLEYFVVDGGSTDNSVDVIRRFGDKISWWVSEKDKGQTEAINKGLRRSTGEIVNWINSDDLVAPGALHHVAEQFGKPGINCVCGPITMFDGNKRWKFDAAFQPSQSFQFVFGIDIYNQPGTFFSRHAIEKMGWPDQRLHYVMDKEWFMRYLAIFGIHHIAVTENELAQYRVHSTTKTSGQTDKFINEYAVLAYRWTEAYGDKRQQSLIAEKFDVVNHAYRAPAISSDEKLAGALNQMNALLLLRRFHRIYTEKDFTFCQRLIRLINWEDVELDDQLKKNLSEVRKDLSFGTWLLFRTARKLGFAGKY